MAMNEPQAEPSMEEILASIRRIIAEDDQGGAPPENEPLDLNEAAQAHREASAEADDLVFEDIAFEDNTPDHTPPSMPEPAVLAPPVPAPAPVPPVAPTPVRSIREEALLSDAVASVTAGALSRLAGSLRLADNPNQTIEGIVRELLQPMLKEWLDENLPAIVDAKVEAALERVARLAR